MDNIIVKSHRKKIEGDITDSLIKKMEKVGQVVERQAKINASHGSDSSEHPRIQSGRLRASISHNWTSSNKPRGDVESEAKSGDGVSNPGGDNQKIIAVVGTNVEYAMAIELGPPNGRHPPYPYLFPAVESSKGKIIDILKGEVISFD